MQSWNLCSSLIAFMIIIFKSCTASLDLHPNHVQFVMRNHPELLSEEINIFDIKNTSCWGYEPGCNSRSSYLQPPKNCVNKVLEDDFKSRVDFGYVKDRQEEKMFLCKGESVLDSSLVCSRYTRFCIGKNLFFNFHNLQTFNGRDKFWEDIFNEGDVGGFCRVNGTLLENQSNHKSPLQSWYAELEKFSQLDFRPLIDAQHCDVVFNHTVVFMKLDYGGNMFHHFCDFFNLYVSQHINNSWFDQDIHIVMWDTATSAYFDPFSVSWKVFTSHPVTTLMELKGKRVCVKDVMFPLLSRMIGGMYYNTYVPDTCVGSTLMRAFSEHFLHRMKIDQKGPFFHHNRVKVRVTLLQRGNPENTGIYRQIRNQPELVEALRNISNIELKVVEYDWRAMAFEEQLDITHNSDVLVGMHGAGLAHFMFLPDWAVAFELYNCGDKHCYYDLARLRGLHYLTWPQDGPAPVPHDQGKHYRYGDNPKFWNWEFDPGTFVDLVKQAADEVLENSHFKQAAKIKQSNSGIKSEL